MSERESAALLAPRLPGQCPSVASWNGTTWHHCARLEGHGDFHLSGNGFTTWPVLRDGEPAWTAPWPKQGESDV
jgi:hypothetical protein